MTMLAGTSHLDRSYAKLRYTAVTTELMKDRLLYLMLLQMQHRDLLKHIPYIDPLFIHMEIILGLEIVHQDNVVETEELLPEQNNQNRLKKLEMENLIKIEVPNLKLKKLLRKLPFKLMINSLSTKMLLKK